MVDMSCDCGTGGSVFSDGGRRTITPGLGCGDDDESRVYRCPIGLRLAAVALRL